MLNEPNWRIIELNIALTVYLFGKHRHNTLHWDTPASIVNFEQVNALLMTDAPFHSFESGSS